jgi:hypothetical protein
MEAYWKFFNCKNRDFLQFESVIQTGFFRLIA